MENYSVLMRCGPDHHTAKSLTGDNTSVHHMAYELRDWADVQAACETLGQHGLRIIWGPGRHEIEHNNFVYIHDSCNHSFEYFIDLVIVMDKSSGFFRTSAMTQGPASAAQSLVAGGRLADLWRAAERRFPQRR